MSSQGAQPLPAHAQLAIRGAVSEGEMILEVDWYVPLVYKTYQNPGASFYLETGDRVGQIVEIGVNAHTGVLQKAAAPALGSYTLSREAPEWSEALRVTGVPVCALDLWPPIMEIREFSEGDVVDPRPYRVIIGEDYVQLFPDDASQVARWYQAGRTAFGADRQGILTALLFQPLSTEEVTTIQESTDRIS